MTHTKRTGRYLHAARILVCTALVGASVSLLPPPSSAAAPVPATPVFPSTIDTARYDREETCDPTAKPGAVELVRIIQRTYGTSLATNIPRACSGTGTSGHHSGRAVDWMTNSRVVAQGEQGDALVRWLLATDQYGNTNAMARRLGVQYVIWRSQTFSVYAPQRGWTEYNGCLTTRTAPTDDNYCHRNHVHISLNWDGALQRSTWYTLQGQTRAVCVTPAAPRAWTAPARTPGGFVPVAPARLLDTRTTTPYGGCQLPAGGRVDLKVTGRAGIPATGVAAVALNVVAVRPVQGTYLSAYPAGASVGTSTVNGAKRENTSAATIVPVGTDGMVSIRNALSPSDVVVDVTGWFPSDGSGLRYTPAPTAQRALDGTLDGGQWRNVPLPLPADASVLVGNIAVDRPSTTMHSTVAPVGGGAAPGTASINSAADQIIANRVITGVQTGTAPSIGVFANTTSRNVLDVSGWFARDGYRFVPVTPARVVDSRTGLGFQGPLPAQTETTLRLAGAGPVPADARVVVASVAVTEPAVGLYLRVWPTGTPQPGTSDLNVARGDTKANLVVVPVSADGKVSISTNAGPSQVVVDVLGYFR